MPSEEIFNREIPPSPISHEKAMELGDLMASTYLLNGKEDISGQSFSLRLVAVSKKIDARIIEMEAENPERRLSQSEYYELGALASIRHLTETSMNKDELEAIRKKFPESVNALEELMNYF
jgi:hypothetical protein